LKKLADDSAEREEEAEETRGSSAPLDEHKNDVKRIRKWLTKGNVIYKSVGLGLMDLTIGLSVIDFAKKKGVGSHVDNF